MKKLEATSWGIWLAFLMLLLFMVSCKSKQPSVDSSLVNKAYHFELDRSLMNVNRTNPNENNFAFEIPKIETGKPECDSICQQKMDELLAMINLQQKNGANETKMYYDKFRRTLHLYNKMAGTVDSIIKHTNIKKQYINITKTRTVTITTNILNDEQKFNVWTGRIFWLLLLIFIIYKIKKQLPI